VCVCLSHANTHAYTLSLSHTQTYTRGETGKIIAKSHSCFGHDSFVFGTKLLRIWDMTHSYVGHDAFSKTIVKSHSYSGHDSFIFGT